MPGYHPNVDQDTHDRAAQWRVQNDLSLCATRVAALEAVRDWAEAMARYYPQEDWSEVIAHAQGAVDAAKRNGL